jgi:hypothetical protein
MIPAPEEFQLSLTFSRSYLLTSEHLYFQVSLDREEIIKDLTISRAAFKLLYVGDMEGEEVIYTQLVAQVMAEYYRLLKEPCVHN